MFCQGVIDAHGERQFGGVRAPQEPAAVETVSCPICYTDDVAADHNLILQCGHSMCRDCAARHVSSVLDQPLTRLRREEAGGFAYNKDNFKCPFCRDVMDHQVIDEFVSRIPDQKLDEKIRDSGDHTLAEALRAADEAEAGEQLDQFHGDAAPADQQRAVAELSEEDDQFRHALEASLRDAQPHAREAAELGDEDDQLRRALALSEAEARERAEAEHLEQRLHILYPVGQ